MKKIPSRVFWGVFKKNMVACWGNLTSNIVSLFIYVRRILECIDWLSICSQLIANQSNNISSVDTFSKCSTPSLEKITFRKKARDAVIQVMTEVDIEEWDGFLLA